MLKKLFQICLSLLMVLGLVFGQTKQVNAAPLDDIQTIKERLKSYFLELDTIDDGSKVETCYVSQADQYLDMLDESGAFPDVNYKSTANAANGKAWDPYLALDRLQAIAIAYHKEGNKLYHKEEAKVGLEKALKYWVTQGSRNNLPDGPYSTNWWENQVGVQLRFSRIGLFMEDVIDDESYQIILEKLIEKTPVKYGSGQNNLWFDQNHVYYALLTNDENRLTDMVDNYLNYCLDTQLDNTTKEAVQVDNSFYMHGRQFYSNGYGMSMFRDMSFWIYMLRDTQFSISEEVMERMANYMINGTSWTIRGDLMELYLGYRPYKFDVGYKNYAAEYIEPLKRMIIADSAHASQYQAILNSIENDTSNGKNGNYYMWRSTYASHMRDDYGVNIKMDSKDVIGGEWRGSWSGENKGQLVYWTSSAVSTVTVDGDEYTQVYPVFDWAHCPGSTTAARIVQDYSNSGRFTNGTNHTIGVTNNQYGNTAYDMDKKGTKAKKGYFFFDDEFVALGTGITSTESVEIHTTLNQNTAENPSVNGVAVPAGTVNKEYTTRSLYNGKIGYVFLEDTQVVVSNDGQKDSPSLWDQEQIDQAPNVFKAYINHGTKPTNGTYAYIVVPNKTEAQVNDYQNNIPVTIVANTTDVQAVRHDGLKQTQINFYKAGTLEYKEGYKITVDQPCSLIIDESGTTRKITVAVSDADANKTVNVELAYDSTKTKTVFVSRPAPYTGQSMTLDEGEDNRYQASSYTTNHGPKNAIDKNLETYWESQTNNEEWISLFTGSNKYIKNVKITWGNHFAKEYDVYVSQDGNDYQLVNSVTDGKGNEEIVPINKICSYVKIVAKSGNDSNYQIKEVTINEGQLLSLNKPVETSSVSTNAPTFTGNLVVDGDLETRWASLRGVDDNWITIDLQKDALIDAIAIHWEAACSDNYQIEISDDNENWTTVKASLKTNDNLNDEIIFDEAISARYVKVHSLKSKVLDKNYGINIYEIEVYGNYVKEPLENIAKSKPVEVSSVSTNAPTFIGALAVDENKGTRWASLRNSDDEWITVDLGVLSEIEEMTIYWEGACSDNYQIQVSDDNKNWTTIKSSLSTDKSLTDKIVFDEAVTARYVKVHSLKSRSFIYGISIYELEIYGRYLEEPPVNIALNKSSVASSAFVDTKDGNKEYVSSLAFDGRTDKIDGQQSRWVSNRETKDEWIYVDLEDYYSIQKIVLNWEGAGAKEYKIQISDDAKNWTDLTHVTDGKGGIASFEYDGSQSGRYVRMYGVEPASKYGFSLWEFEVYGTLDEPENIALNKPSKASSEYTNPNSKFKLESKYAFDGSTEDRGETYQSRWVSLRRKENPGVNVDSQWIYVDLQDKYNISKVVLNWEGACAKEYKVQVSNDGENWTDISHITNGVAGVKELTYQDVYGQYVRVECIEPAGQYGYSLWEFEVYGRALKVDLQGLYDECKAIDQDLYTPNSYSAFKEALDKAESVLKTTNASDSLIKDTYKQLEEAKNSLVKQADKTALKTTIEEAENIVEDKYTPNSVQALKEILIQAQTVYNDKNATQTEVDTMINTLQTAYRNLVEQANRTELEKAIEAAKNIKDDQYTPNSVEAFKEIITQAQAVYDDKNATQIEVDAAVDILQSAQGILVEKGDKTSLKTAIDNARTINEKLYTPSSVEEFKNVISEIEKVYTNDNATKEDVENALNMLKVGYEKLVVRADNSQLQAVIEEVKDIDEQIYTPESYKILQEAIQEAEVVVNNPEATKDDINKAIENINQAKNELVEIQRTSLEKLLSQVKAVDQTKYTDTSLKELETAIKNAESALKTTDQKKIDEAYAVLKKAYEGLEEKEENTTKPEEPGESQGGSEGTTTTKPDDPNQDKPDSNKPGTSTKPEVTTGDKTPAKPAETTGDKTPNKPEEITVEEVTEKDDEKTVTAVEKEESGKQVKTSDEAPIMLLTLGLIASGMGYAIIRKRKEI